MVSADYAPALGELIELAYQRYVRGLPDKFGPYQKFFEQIRDRTQDPAKNLDLKTLYAGKLDERTIRRKIAELSDLLAECFGAESLPYGIAIVQIGRGNPSQEVRLRWHTFEKVSLPHAAFFLRKWYGRILPSRPGQIAASEVHICFPVKQSDDGDWNIRYGDSLLLTSLKSSIEAQGLKAVLHEAGMFNIANPNILDYPAVFIGCDKTNPFLEKIRFPLKTDVRYRDRSILHNGKRVYVDVEPGAAGEVFALVTVMRSESGQILYLFETGHSRAAEALGWIFGDFQRMEWLATSLRVDPLQEFPMPLQIVFGIRITEHGRILGGQNAIRLVEYWDRRTNPGDERPGPIAMKKR